MPNTVFISYRREDGSTTAQLLKQVLKASGYDVFLDVVTLQSGDWEAKIREEIGRRSHFILVLTPLALQRCADEADMVRREILIALETRRNIVPVCQDHAIIKDLRENCPAAVQAIFTRNIAFLRHQGFDNDLAELLAKFLAEHCAAPPYVPSALLAAAGATLPPCQQDLTRILDAAPVQLIGRESELARLDAAWHGIPDSGRTKSNVITIVAWGGVGKSSLVASWATQLLNNTRAGCEMAFAWSFYSQGTREQGAASGDMFLNDALRFFGGANIADSPTSSHEKGRQLARLLQCRRTLLILDGLEPLQHGEQRPLAGALKDPGVRALLRELALRNSGLCIVTTRERLSDLAAFRQTTAPELHLGSLSTSAGGALLSHLGVTGENADFEALVSEVRGHALTLQLVGTYLRAAHHGSIRRRYLFEFSEADAAIQGGHAFRAIAAYERWFAAEGEAGQRALAILRVLGLFDRPATTDLLTTLRQPPPIPDLTTSIVLLTDSQWNMTVTRLQDCELILKPESTVTRPLLAHNASLDCHPLIREYFARQLKTQTPAAWRAAHARLYEHILNATQEGDAPTLLDLEPLYQAIWHGCHAGLHAKVHAEVFTKRLRKDGRLYSMRALGAVQSDLAALSCFFEKQWSLPVSSFPAEEIAELFHSTAYSLRALGRLDEAYEPMRSCVDIKRRECKWKDAASYANSLAELLLVGGNVTRALETAAELERLSRMSNDIYLQLVANCRLAEINHTLGRLRIASSQFASAENMQAILDPSRPLLFSINGFRICEFLLTEAERLMWDSLLCQLEYQYDERLLSYGNTCPVRSSDREALLEFTRSRSAALAACQATSQRVSATQQWERELKISKLGLALGILSESRVLLYASQIDRAQSESQMHSMLSAALFKAESAYSGIVASSQWDFVPHALLTRACILALRKQSGDLQSAHSDLNEAWEIAERSPMPLFMADVLLYRARLWGSRKDEAGRMKEEKRGYPWGSVHDDLAHARRLIVECGYKRRLPELEAAERALIPS